MAWHAHLVCVNCWNEKNPTKQTKERAGPPCGKCCACGRATASGIYVRGDDSAAWAHCSCQA
jgi:hypothetical protein